MKPVTPLLALALPAFLVACNPASDRPGSAPVDPLDIPAEAPAEPAGAPAPVLPAPWALTAFEPQTVEIYCSFFRTDAAGNRGDRVFITEIAGIPAPAAIGLEGQPVKLEEVSKNKDGPIETWTYRSAERGAEVELLLTETEKGFESRDYEGSIQVTRPEAGAVQPIVGSCGV